MKGINRERLGRKCAVLAAVIVVSFLCGWSATGLTGGIVLAVVMGAATAAPVFSDTHTDCSVRLVRRRTRERSK